MARVDTHDILRDDTIASLYDAAVEPATRRRGLSMLAQALDAAGAFYLIWDKDNNSLIDCVAAGALTADYAALYRARWGIVDPRRRFLERAHVESIFVSHYDRVDAVLEDGGFERAFLAEQGIAHSLGANLTAIGHDYRQVYIERAVGRAPFAAAEVVEFRRLVHHMANAERLARAVDERALDWELPQRILDNMSVGALVADQNGQLRFANAAAEEILAENDGLSRRDNRIQAARSFETNSLLAALRDVAAAGRAEKRDGALLIARPSGKRPYAIVVMPLPSGFGDAKATRALIFVSDLAHRNSELAPRLSQLFGLSKAEARVAAGIAEGRRLTEIAQEFDVRMPTVRTQLRAVLKKVGATRQADLVRIVLALPPMLATGAESLR
ncbi:MAG TPA: LuxR C-terminal-related transcriptional regulator [Stellaceae bacterium]|jgi:DNA-binding CsgD family transcriptional regulator/PAS domain-containing protein|nr:LuxR C-terminal-related transcriptional regulator [Stellaceae bacterium]